jgi:tetratricopeptide (TPR) repeat protein
VRKGGGRVSIAAQLIDALSGAHLWAERFDGVLEDVFELQDKVALSVAGVIEPALQAAETGRGVHRPTNDLTAYDLYLRAYAMAFSSPSEVVEAVHLLERAIRLDPRYGPALAYAAICCMRLHADGSTEDPTAESRKGTDFAWRALHVSDDDPGVLANAAYALAYFGEDIGAMVALVDRALTLNPSFARGWYISADLRLFAGQHDAAIEHIEASLRLSPRGNIGPRSFVIGGAHFINRRFDEALPQLLAAIQGLPSHRYAYRYLAACYAHTGRLNEARQVVERLRTMTPQIVPSVSHLRNAEHRELLLSGLRMAMGDAA